MIKNRLLVVSAERNNRKTIDQELASKILRTVPISEAFLFFLDIGDYNGEFAASLGEFFTKLKKIPLKSIEFHFRRGDFQRWFKETLGDEYLANRIRNIDRTHVGEAIRIAIQRMVKKRLDELVHTSNCECVSVV